MLTYMLHQLDVLPGHLADAERQVVFYTNSLITRGFLARLGRTVCAGRPHNRVLFGGILTHAKAIEDAGAVAALRECWTDLSSCAVTCGVASHYDVASSTDLWYCTHETWKSLRLEADEFFGTTPVRCNDCQGLVGRYRLPLSDNTQSQLWLWDTHYRSISSCWLASSAYESWAGHELFDAGSLLNTDGSEIAEAMSLELGIEVSYAVQKPAQADDEGG